MYQLDEKIWFWCLLTIPVIVVLFSLLQIWRVHTQKRFADKRVLKKLSPNRSIFKSVLKVFVLSLAFLSLTIALVNPKIGTKLETVKREGVDIVFAVDVSKNIRDKGRQKWFCGCHLQAAIQSY